MPDVEARAILLNDGELAARLRQENIPVDVLDESKLSSSAIFFGLTRLLRKQQPNVLHTHRQKENILGAIANAFSVRAKSVRTIHGANENPPKRVAQRIVHALDNWTGNHLQHKIIAVSKELAEKLEQFFSRDRIVVIENGVDVEAVRASVKPVEFRENEPNAIHIGIVGRLDAVKRIDIFLEMAKLLIDEQPELSWRFHIFGEGKLESILKEQSQQLNIDNSVIFHGHRTDIASCIAALDALVMCSDHEGLPMTALEAMALGTPIVVHAVGGLNKLLQNNSGGVLVVNHTPIGYATELKQLLQQNREQIRTQGMQRLREHYTADANADLISQLYGRC